MSVDRLNSTEADDDTLKEVPDKKFYVAMDFYQVDNFHFHAPGLYPLSAVARDKHLYSPQMNRISFRLPPVPPLTQFRHLDEEVRTETVFFLSDPVRIGLWVVVWGEG